MRRAILLASTLLFLSACGSSDDAPSQDEQQAAVDAGELSPADAAFEDYVRGEGLADTDADVNAVRELAQSICDAYDRGATFDEVIEAARNSYTEYEAGQLNGAATAAYCPEHATT